jgi:curli biogenesis system outer membrane secretion channel CsgG
MKRARIILALLALCLLSWANDGALAQAKKRVAVFVFEDKTDHRYHWWNGQPVGDGMSEMLTTTLVKSGKYRVMERAQMEKLLQEQGLGMSGAVTPQTAAQAGLLQILLSGINGANSPK